MTDGATRPAGTLEQVQNSHRNALSRRQMLAVSAGAALLLLGCSTPAPQPAEPAPVDALQGLFDEHVTLAQTYRNARADDSDPVLHALADNAHEHLLALAGALAVPAPTAALEASAGQPSSAPIADKQQLRAQLREREAAAAARCSELALHAPQQRVALLAALSAAHHCAAMVLA